MIKKFAFICVFIEMFILCSISLGTVKNVDLRGIESDPLHYRIVDLDDELAKYKPEDYYGTTWLKLYDYTIDAEIARKLGDEAIKWYWGENVLKHTKYEVYEVEEKDYFVITRKPKYLFGATYQVCISKTDGAILRAEKL